MDNIGVSDLVYRPIEAEVMTTPVKLVEEEMIIQLENKIDRLTKKVRLLSELLQKWSDKNGLD